MGPTHQLPSQGRRDGPSLRTRSLFIESGVTPSGSSAAPSRRCWSWGTRSCTCLSWVLSVKALEAPAATADVSWGFRGLRQQPFSGRVCNLKSSALLVCRTGLGTSLTLRQQVGSELAAVLGAGATKIAKAWCLPSSDSQPSLGERSYKQI